MRSSCEEWYIANEAQYIHLPYLTLSEGTGHRVIVECLTITPTPPRGRRAGVLFLRGLSLFPENAHLSFCGRAQRTYGTQRMHMYTHVSVRLSKGFRVNEETGERQEDYRRERVVEVKIERREKIIRMNV